MDIAEFAAIRPARTADLARVARPRTQILVPRLPGGSPTHVPPPIKLEAESLPDTLGDRGTDPLARDVAEEDASVLERILTVLHDCERALAAAGDQLDEAGLGKLVTDELARHRLDSEDWAKLLGGKADNEVIFPIAQLVVDARWPAR